MAEKVEDKEVSSSDEEAEVKKQKGKNKGSKKGEGGKGGKGGGGGGGRKKQNPEIAESVLTPEEIGRMIDLGLGRGVDATSPSPWLNKSAFQVREVTPHNIIGTEEGGVLQSYSHEVASVQAMQTSMSASVPVSQQVSVGVDAELSRSYSTNRRSVGKKIITRSISYRADFEDLNRHKSITSMSLPDELEPQLLRQASTNKEGKAIALTFEERLAKWILERLFEEEVENVQELSDNDDSCEVLATFIAEWPGNVKEIKQMIGQKCREFINHFCITHYVSSLELGASQYRVMTEEDYQTQIGMKGSLGIEQMASVSTEQKLSFGRRSKSSELTKIGRFEKNTVNRGTTEEAVVGVKFQPISALVKMRILRNKLQNAIRNYIDNQEHSKAGPFIMCCNDETIFLKVTRDFKVVGTTKIEESSNFFVSSNEDGDHPYEFSIMYMAPSLLEGRGIKPIPRYLYAPVNTFGKNEGPLTLRLDAKDTKTRMTLNSRRVRHFNPVDIKDWVNSKDIFYINCKQRAVKKNGFICVKKTPHDSHVPDEYITYCVPTIKKHNEDKDHFMLFRLIRAGKRDPPKQKKENDPDDEPLGVRRKKQSKLSKKSSLISPSDGPTPEGEEDVDSGIKKRGEGGGGEGKKQGGGGGGRKNKGEGGGGGRNKERIKGKSEIAEKMTEVMEGEEETAGENKEAVKFEEMDT